VLGWSETRQNWVKVVTVSPTLPSTHLNLQKLNQRCRSPGPNIHRMIKPAMSRYILPRKTGSGTSSLSFLMKISLLGHFWNQDPVSASMMFMKFHCRFWSRKYDMALRLSCRRSHFSECRVSWDSGTRPSYKAQRRQTRTEISRAGTGNREWAFGRHSRIQGLVGHVRCFLLRQMLALSSYTLREFCRKSIFSISSGMIENTCSRRKGTRLF